VCKGKVLLGLLIVQSFSYSFALKDGGYERKSQDRFIAELHSYLFLPSGRKLKTIYGKHWVRQQIKALINVSLTDSIWNNVYVFFGFDFLKHSGKTSLNSSPSNIAMTPFLAGLRYSFPVRRWLRLMADCGIYYPFVRIHNRQTFKSQLRKQTGPFIREYESHSAAGGIVQGGISFLPDSMLSIDLNINYSFAQIGRSLRTCSNGVKESALRLSGFNVGGGVGFHF